MNWNRSFVLSRAFAFSLPLLALISSSCVKRQEFVKTTTDLNTVRENLEGIEGSMSRKQASLGEEVQSLKTELSALRARDDEIKQLLVRLEQKVNVNKIESDEELRQLTEINREFGKSIEANLKKVSDGLGTRIKVTAGKHVQFNHATTTVSYNSSSDRRVHFGLGNAAVVDRIELLWPSGAKQELTGVKADRVLEVVEPARSAANPSAP